MTASSLDKYVYMPLMAKYLTWVKLVHNHWTAIFGGLLVPHNFLN